MKEESPMEKEWRRWSTSFSSVPAFTYWERETADWGKTGRKRGRERARKEVPVTGNKRPFFSNAHPVSRALTYHPTVGGSMLLFD